jgi:hypothetical protein
MKKVYFNVRGSMNVPDDVIPHYDVAGKLYALEFNDIMYMLQMCLVAEGGAWGNETITDFQELENHSITNVRYDEAEFGEIQND